MTSSSRKHHQGPRERGDQSALGQGDSKEYDCELVVVVSGCLMAWYWNPFAGCSWLRFLLIATQVEQSDRRCTAPQMHPLRNSPKIAQIQVNKSPLNSDLRVLGDTIFAISSPLSLKTFFVISFAHSFKCFKNPYVRRFRHFVCVFVAVFFIVFVFVFVCPLMTFQ